MRNIRALSTALGLVFFTALLAACGGDDSSPTEPDGPGSGDQDPVVTLTPAADTLVAIDDELDYSAGVVRADGSGAPDSEASWSSTDTSVATVDGEGRAVARTAGVVRIVASFEGVADTADLVVAPEVAEVVVSPANDTVDGLGGQTSLAADPRDANGYTVESATASWGSSDTAVATVDSAGTVTGWMPGEADVVATAGEAADSARIVVIDPAGDQAPLVSIDSPDDGTTFTTADTIEFRGSASDLEDGPLTGSDLAWSSDVDGSLGTGEQLSTSGLSAGDHVVTLTATDSQGQTGSDSVSVTVRHPANLVLDRMRTLRRGVLTSEAAVAGGVVYNTGVGPSGPFDWELTLDGVVVAQGTVSDLAAGDSVHITPRDLGTLAEGQHAVELTVDAGDAVAETDESDNSGWDRIVSYPAGFSIELDYLTAIDSTHREAFEAASSRWSQLVTADLPDQTFSSPQNFDFCADGAGDRSAPIDDMLIFVRVDSIDGPGNVLGQAGPCTVRTDGETGGYLTASSGRMTFDEADLDQLAADGELEAVILHEMGHVLGIGSLWPSQSLVDTTVADDPVFTGAAGRVGFSEVGGDTYDGVPVPVANTGGSGTELAHWRESVLDNELMTGFLNSGQANPLSEVTVRSLGDQFYAVDPSAADSYQVPSGSALRTSSVDRRELGDDLIDVSVRALDRRGRVIYIGAPPRAGSPR